MGEGNLIFQGGLNKVFEIKLDLFPEFELNPTFTVENYDELFKMIDFFFKNNYDVFVRKVE